MGKHRHIFSWEIMTDFRGKLLMAFSVKNYRQFFFGKLLMDFAMKSYQGRFLSKKLLMNLSIYNIFFN